MFTLKGKAQLPWHDRPRAAEVSWDDGVWAGDPVFVDRLEWMAESEVEMPVTPTGPFVRADAEDPVWAWLAALSLYAELPLLMAGQTPLLPVASIPDGAVA